MNSYIYDKTEKGREEIATRKYHVPAKLRTLLVMIDGRHPLETLMRNFGGLGLNEDSVSLLLKEEYITLIGGAPEPELGAKRPASVESSPASAARAKMAERSRLAAARLTAAPTEEQDEFDLDDLVEHERAILPTPTIGGATASASVLAASPDSAAPQMSDSERFRALHEFYNQTIKSLLGFRGFTLQMKVEKASNLADMRALRLTYLQAVYKSKGSEMTRSVRERLDQLLGGKPAVDDFTMSEG